LPYSPCSNRKGLTESEAFVLPLSIRQIKP
jgi:hypothetical protein